MDAFDKDFTSNSFKRWSGQYQLDCKIAPSFGGKRAVFENHYTYTMILSILKTSRPLRIKIAGALEYERKVPNELRGKNMMYSTNPSGREAAKTLNLVWSPFT